MTTAAFVLVFGSAFCHASWNFLLKRSDHKVAFLGCFAAVAFVAFLIPTAVAVYVDGLSSKGAGVGIALVVFGIYVIHVEGRDLRGLTQPLRSLGRPATRIAVVTGTLIAAYSLGDKSALDPLSPLALNQFAMAGHALVLLPVAMLTAQGAVRGEWRERAPSIMAAGGPGPAAYVLVLVPLTTSRISYGAPARAAGGGAGG